MQQGDPGVGNRNVRARSRRASPSVLTSVACAAFDPAFRFNHSYLTMRRVPFISRRTQQRAHRLWPHYGVFWIGAIGVGLVAVLYAELIDLEYRTFLHYANRYWWLPLLVTPAITALCVWLTRRFFPGSEGSGIPQVIATLHGGRGTARRLLTLRILAGKIVISFLSILGGLTIGREGPTIHVGAALMYNLRSFYPERFRAIRGGTLERRLALAGAAAGLSAAFNAPLAGVVFAIGELSRIFEQRTGGVPITAIIFAGVVALSLEGNYTYFGTINIVGAFPDLLIVAVVVIGVVAGVAGGIFCWLLLNTHRWMPHKVSNWRARSPVMFGAACGLFIAVIGVCSNAHTFGSGYAEARGMLSGMGRFQCFIPFSRWHRWSASICRARLAASSRLLLPSGPESAIRSTWFFHRRSFRCSLRWES